MNEPNRESSLFHRYADVLLPYPLEQTLTYLLPDGVEVDTGWMVEVPLKNRTERAVVVMRHSHPPDVAVKEMASPLFEGPVVSEAQIELARWMSDYYLCSPGEALFKMFPSPHRLKRKSSSDPASRDFSKSSDKGVVLNHEQESVFSLLRDELDSGMHSVHLLHGITGSGKTEIYIRVLQHVLDKNRSGILLVPEISLTVQMIRRLESTFGNELALLHSGRHPKERFVEYMDVLSGRRRIVVGTRSAVFAPVHRPGIIILDEEHDASYREHSHPRYDARQIARRRCEMESAVLLLGSATPRVEMRYAAERYDVRRNAKSTQRFFYHRLTERASGALPEVRIIEQQKDACISRTLLLEIEKNFKNGEQTVLLLNRRGYQPYVQCRSCKAVVECPRCSVGLTVHRDGRLLCHQCGWSELERKQCRICGGLLKKQGTAVQRVEEFLLDRFPSMRIERLDTDAAARIDVEDVLTRFLEGRIDLLTGTQMIAKGLDSPRVTLVGVLQADRGLALPDFRAQERVFSLLMQVAGRAGRGNHAGRVFFEALNTEHPVLQLAREQNYDRFFAAEIAGRMESGYPPFRRLIRILIRSREEAVALKRIEELAGLLKAELSEKDELLGPAPAPLTKLHNRYRYHMILKTTAPEGLRKVLKERLASFRARLGEKAFLEVEFDPIDLL
jgi:primosomal protein N' (replication factor Y)